VTVAQPSGKAQVRELTSGKKSTVLAVAKTQRCERLTLGLRELLGGVDGEISGHHGILLFSLPKEGGGFMIGTSTVWFGLSLGPYATTWPAYWSAMTLQCGLDDGLMTG
jgi:hypothetical protein